MSIDKTLKPRSRLSRARNVLKRHERIEKLKEEEKWDEEAGPLGLPKVRVRRAVIGKKKKKKKKEDEED